MMMKGEIIGVIIVIIIVVGGILWTSIGGSSIVGICNAFCCLDEGLLLRLLLRLVFARLDELLGDTKEDSCSCS